MPSEETNAATRREWRELGFFYHRDDTAKEWRVVGSVDGLQAFASEIRQYALNPANELVSEHIHLGPYMYLEIGTWTEPEITDHWIAGPLNALLGLSAFVEKQIPTLKPDGLLKLREAFAPTSPYDLVVQLAEDGFDPAKADQDCW